MTNRLAIIAILLSCLAGLLVFEVIRPFRDLSIDGPVALGAWGVGIVLSIAALLIRRGSRVLPVTALVANVLPLSGALVLLWLLSRTNFTWH